MRDLIELPYDNTGVCRAIDEETDLDSLRTRIYRAIKDSYREEVDMANAKRIADECLERGMRLVGGRFSRAFYIDAMLMASAQVLSLKCLQKSIERLGKIVKRLPLPFRTEELKGGDFSFEMVGAEIQRIINLTSREKVSQAEGEGIIGKLKEALRKFESRLGEELDRIQAERSQQIAEERRVHGGESKTWQGLVADRNQLQEKAGKLREAIAGFEGALVEAPRENPVFVAFFQRLFPLDALNMGMLNERKDPFFGEDEEVHRLIEESSSHIYVTPNLRGWLRKCDDWVEALPAYATYQIVPSERGYKIRAWVQRSILEDVYRRHAEDWALNIEEVMDLEHIALARSFLIEKMNLQEEVERLSRKEGSSEEEAIRQTLRKKGWSEEIGNLAAITEATYLKLCGKVAQRRQEEGLSRREALDKMLREGKNKKNLLTSLLKEEGQSLFKALRKLVEKQGLGERAKALTGLALKRRRPLPSIHVLTTLGPGETEINVQNWLEESMSLFNVSRACQLEEKVKEKVRQYEEILAAAGQQIIEELDLEGDLHNIIQEEGLKAEEREDRAQAILKLIASYPEVALEVAKLSLLLEKEAKGEGQDRLKERSRRGKEPHRVEEYLRRHPGLKREALRTVIKNNRLEKEVKDYLAKHQVKEEEAERAVVEGNVNYRAEKKSLEKSRARSRVLEEQKLSEELRTYLRYRLDPLLATTLARREIIAEKGLSAELNSPRFRYEAAGPFKKYNLLYTPSRVDLGAEEVHSVRNVPKWVGGLDGEAARAGKSLYSLYNVAAPTAVESPRLAEFLKVGENFFSRGGVFYLSLAAGVNIDALGQGDFEFFRNEWNQRGDRIVLPGGETYGGFCVPKEFSLLYAIIIAAVNPETREEVLHSFSIPGEIREEVVKDLRKLLRLRLDCSDPLEWEMKAAQFLQERYRRYFSQLGGTAYIARLPQLARTMEKMGLIAPQDEEEKHWGYELAYWVNKKAQGLEEINRSGPFRKVHLIRQLIKESRRKNPAVAPDNKLIGAMGASYKEGEIKRGKEIPVTDVRFSAGARKLEIYAGTAEEHLLKDIDPEGREIWQRIFKDFRSPADIRLVGTCTGSDILNHVPGAGLEEIKEEVYGKLREAGLDDSLLEANGTVYGGDLENWSGIKEMEEEERQRLIKEIGPKIHLLVLDRRGVYGTYEQAVQGIDFLDLSIPDPELLDLIDNLPWLFYLMRKGRPHSALVFADGTSGARRRAFSYRYSSSKRKVKELFALSDKAVYGALGLGRDTVESWREEMSREREKVRDLFTALTEERYEEARGIYQRIREEVRRREKAEEAIREEVRAKELGLPSREYRYISEALGKVEQGLTLPQLDFATYLILGGQYLFNGKLTREELQEKRAQFERAIAKLRKKRAGSKKGAKEISLLVKPLEKSPVDYLERTLVKPRYLPPPPGAYREVETGIAGSLKAVEEKVARLENRETRRRQARRATLLRERSRAFASVEKEVAGTMSREDFEEAYRQARARLGEPGSSLSASSFGRFLRWTKAVFSLLWKEASPGDSSGNSLLDSLFTGGEIDLDLYRELAAHTAKLGEGDRGDRALLEKVARVLELLDIALLVEKTEDREEPEEMMLEMARFFDLTLNSHIFDCLPYHYHKERGAGFQIYSRQEKFELARRRHRWLYAHLRHLMSRQTELRESGEPYQEIWLGDADRNILPLGVNVEDPAQCFWFSYLRLRDVAVLRHEGYPLPELFLDLDPDLIKAEERTNAVIVYPHGNTTVPVALEQGAHLSRSEEINLMLTAFPFIVEDANHGRKLLQIKDAFMYVSAEDYGAILKGSGVDRKEAEERARKVGGEGILLAVRFRRPVTAHALFFHFTHPLRPQVEEIGLPLIQPFVWEAATHLKCRLPEMLKGSSIRSPDQINWYEKERASFLPGEVRKRIEKKIISFSKEHPTLIVKPEKESGGRKAKILAVRDKGKILPEKVRELRDLAYDIAKTDNVVIQEVLPSYVRRLYTREFLEEVVDRFAKIGLAVLLDRDPQTPLFSYFRQILVRGKKGYEISHHITVLSTQGIANVGQGGLLYEYKDEIINSKYREDLRRETTKAAYNSLRSQRKYIKSHRKEILSEYLTFHREYAGKLPAKMGRDLTGFSSSDIPYEMGDYMPVFLTDEKDNLVRLYDEDKEKFRPLFDKDGHPTRVKIYDEKGRTIPRTKAGRPLSLPLFDEGGGRIPRFDAQGRPISSLVAFKIEPNPGAGLWRPHNDQLPEERKGEGVYTIFRCLGERGAVYREKLSQLVKRGKSAPKRRRTSGCSLYLPVKKSEPSPETTDPTLKLIDEAVRKVREELGKGER